MKKFAIAAVTSAAAMATATPAMAGAALQVRPVAQCVVPTAADLDAQFTRFNDAWKTKNPDTVTAMFDNDAVLLATVASRPRTTLADIRDYFVSFLKNSPVARIDTSTIKAGCNWALRAGTWTVALTNLDTGAKSDVNARYTFLYQYDAGVWEIEHLHSSVFPAKP